MARVRDWVAGARPRTLPASLAPVIAGTAAAARPGFGWGQGLIWWRLAMALVVALALQIGVNYANDYSDGLRGTDDERRVGPRRLVGSGLAEPGAVRRAAALAGLLAGGAGLTLAAFAGWWLLAVGAACLAAGWFYSGGRRPYGYRGWGEVGVFVFFGFVAAVGSAYVQVEAITARSVWVGVGCGCLSCALLVANNLRDITGDAAAGKRTLAVRMGVPRTRLLYTALVAGAFVGLIPLALSEPWAMLGLAALPFAVGPLARVLRGAAGLELIGVLAATGRLLAVYGLTVATGLWLASALT
ncbi:MAG: 1,4-dihydroxy-2-naphthoate polyprenyltransferase [Acidimicrobiia bacterium]|nr:1,4-dihydroxy-2-naphthoate polyprenyltransferase [Acidimicrobiia bacterium]MYC46557.1 1,4-dihydroxy-2-naphthoate polyprenyltransferase [Acidimicrobiia bacterium]MYI18756.1 1,4-dihydroxy-2-naphthoate polyprenyltransferase [Acidimicrobiia bacterium]